MIIHNWIMNSECDVFSDGYRTVSHKPRIVRGAGISNIFSPFTHQKTGLYVVFTHQMQYWLTLILHCWDTSIHTWSFSFLCRARVCVRAQMCVLSARVLMSPRLFDGKGEWGGEGRPALARPPLSVYSLCVFSGGSICLPLSFSLSLSDSLCFLVILLSFMFSPLLYMIARSKPTPGTGLQC